MIDLKGPRLDLWRGDVFRLRLVETSDRGRCLAAAVDVAEGHRWRDEALVVGSSRGRRLARLGDDHVASAELSAALDFVAALFEVDDAPLRQLRQLYAAEEVNTVKMLRRCHGRWRPQRGLEDLEELWRHVTHNWRQLTVACPVQREVTVDGVALPVLSHDTVGASESSFGLHFH